MSNVSDSIPAEADASTNDGGLNDLIDFADGLVSDIDTPSSGSNEGAPADVVLPAEGAGDGVAPSGEAPTSGAQTAAAPNQEAPTAGAQAPEEDIEVLRRQLEQALATLAQTGMQPKPANLERVEVPSNPKEMVSLDWLEGKDPTDFFENPAEFNNLINRVVTVAIRTAEASAHERTMLAIPGIVATSAKQHMDMQSAVADFYTANPDLAKYKQAVALAATQINMKEPSLPLNDLFQKAGTLTREILRLKAQTAPVAPAFANAASGARPQAPVLSDIEKQIEALLDI